ncbi:B-cell receptor CD22 [Nelusetta ayraudi]|uniref:B-cell receptor CD22 n=1 Tax=Nelusetta ayraudi TaxID=303726 RepID=UPI003F70A9FA
MKMKAHSRKCFLFWALIRMIFTCIGICHAQNAQFSVQNSMLSATEGSCAEIKCKAESYLRKDNGKLFWMKDPVWDSKRHDFVNITYVYSTDQQDVSADFAARVKYIGGRPPWYRDRTCSIQICNLKKTDSGNYMFRFVGTTSGKHSTQNTTLTVTENQCLITFTGPPVVVVVEESETISLSCSTLPSCPSYPQIQELPESTTLQEDRNDKKILNATFEATWQDNGKEFKCQTPDNTDQHLVKKFNLTVQYGPRKPSIHPIQNQVKVGGSLKIFCNTAAEPAPEFYTWYRHTTGTHVNTSVHSTSTEKYLDLTGLKRGDEACYSCSATNFIRTGESSEEACVEVLYSPTNLQLLMDPEVQEHQLVTIICTVESWPPSQLTLRGKRSSAILPLQTLHSNVLNYTFTATPAHKGTYTCCASNSEGSSQITQRDLVVRYGPTDVEIQAPAGWTGNENSGLTLLCSASADPEASFTWWKVAHGAREELRRNRTLVFDSLRASDSGQYSCSASNDIGTGHSELAEVKVKYAPKLTVISRVAEQQQPDGRSSVRLSCSSHCYPPASQYSWFKRATDEPGDKDVLVFSYQNVTVDSDKPGFYYCKARNEMGERSSDSEPLFVEGGFMKALKYGLLFLFILILLIIVIGIYRWRRSKSVQRSSKTTNLRFGFLSAGNNARARLREPAYTSHSRDDMSYSQPTPQHPYRCPDVAPASELYSMVNLPTTNPGTSAQKPSRQGDSNTTEGSLQYASLQFDKRKKTQEPKAEDNVVYAKVSKRKVVEDHGVYSWDSDTSEEDTGLNYTQVSFPAKAEHERTRKDSSSSEKEETNYSEVKF